MVRSERDGGVARFIIDRPSRRNAIDAATACALGDAIEAATRDRALRVLVIKGAGTTFSTGRDLKASAAADREKSPQKSTSQAPATEDEAWVRIFHLLHRSPLPSVAVVTGHAVAGGFTLAMGCDFVLAEKGARFGAFEMRHGFPAAVCTPILARLIGPRLALELALLGEEVSAERLHAVGLVNRLAEDLDDLARVEATFVGHLATLDPTAVRQTRDLMRAAANMPLDNALDMGRNLNQLIAASGGFAAAGRKLARNDSGQQSG